MITNLVFVYGTLRKGEVNHHLLDGAPCCGAYTTPPRYKMINLGAYPAVVSGGAHAIHGEIYRIGRRQLSQLDRLEEYPSLYTRKLIPTPWGKAWIYLYMGRRERYPLIPTGNWQGYSRRTGPFSLY